VPDDNAPKSASKILEDLYEFLEGSIEDVRSVPIERVLKDLKRDNVDPAPLVQVVRDRLNAARAAEVLAKARAERARIGGLAGLRISGEASSSLRDRALRGLQGLSARNPESVAAYWRKFESASDADLESILSDLALLDQIDRDDGDEQ
jgi:hypothetical protein